MSIKIFNYFQISETRPCPTHADARAGHRRTTSGRARRNPGRTFGGTSGRASRRHSGFSVASDRDPDLPFDPAPGLREPAGPTETAGSGSGHPDGEVEGGRDEAGVEWR